MSNWKQDILIRDLEFFSRSILALHHHLGVALDNSQPGWYRATNAEEAVGWVKVACGQYAAIRSLIR